MSKRQQRFIKRLDKQTQRDFDGLVRQAINRERKKRIDRETALPGHRALVAARPEPSWKKDKRI